MTDLLLSHDLCPDEYLCEPPTLTTGTTASSRAAAEVEELSRHTIDCFNARIYDDARLIDHIASDFSGKHDHFPSARSYSEFVQLNKRMAEQHPGVQCKVIDTSVQVHDRQAKVFCFVLTTGYPDGIRRQTMNIFKWQRRQQKWLLRHVHATGSVHPARARLFEERLSSRSPESELLADQTDDIRTPNGQGEDHIAEVKAGEAKYQREYEAADPEGKDHHSYVSS